MRKRLVYLMLGVVLVGSLLAGCGKEATKEKETSSTTAEQSQNEEETGTSETTDDATSGSETTIETPTTTVKQEETTTKKEEVTTTKKQEATTTKKQQETTTKKQETTTAKQEETTTKKEEETTTQTPVVAGTWFEQKGYVITAKNLATNLGNTTSPAHECSAIAQMIEIEDSDYIDGYKAVLCNYGPWCSECSGNIEPFDRYTGVAFYSSSTSQDDGYERVEIMIDGKMTPIYLDISKGGSGYTIGVHCPKDYDGVVMLWGNSNDIIIKSEFERGSKLYTLDEVYNYSAEDVYFLALDDK